MVIEVTSKTNQKMTTAMTLKNNPKMTIAVISKEVDKLRSNNLTELISQTTMMQSCLLLSFCPYEDGAICHKISNRIAAKRVLYTAGPIFLRTDNSVRRT